MSETAIRGLAALALIGLFALLEALNPARARVYSRMTRWPTNLLLGAINVGLLRVASPVLAIAAAELAQSRGIGLFNQLALPPLLECLGALIILDGIIFGQHLMFHRLPVLWRIHGVHHADRDVDVTTALRFHPLEQILSAGIKALAVLALGAAPLAVLLFEVMLSGMALFNHANLALPRRLDAGLRRLLVTPAMHRLHHAAEPGAKLPNYGFCLSLWDRALGTFADPARHPEAFVLGLPGYADHRPTRLGFVLALPFARQSPLDSRA